MFNKYEGANIPCPALQKATFVFFSAGPRDMNMDKNNSKGKKFYSSLCKHLT